MRERRLHRGPEDQRAREVFARRVHHLRLLLLISYLSALLAIVLFFVNPLTLFLGMILVVGTSMVFHFTAGRVWRCPFCDHRYHPRSAFLLLRNPPFCYHCGEALLPVFPEPPQPRPQVMERYRHRRTLHRLFFWGFLSSALFLGLGWRMYSRGYPATGSVMVFLGLAMLVVFPLADLWNWRCPHCNRYLVDHPLITPRFCPFCGIRLVPEHPHTL